MLHQKKTVLKKSIDKLSIEIDGLRARLANPKFLNNAPKAVVKETNNNLTLREAEEAQLKAAHTRLSALE